MFWALLFGTLFAVLGSGSEGVFLSPKGKKIIKKYTRDNPQKKKILSLMKEYKQQAKPMKKKERSMEKELEAQFKNRSVPKSDLYEVFYEYIEQRKLRQDLYISKSLQIKKLITDEEWAMIIPKAEQEHKKVVKKQSDYISKLKKSNDKILKKSEKVVVDRSRKERIREIMLNFSKEEIKKREAIDRFNFQEVAALKNKDASLEDMNEVRDSLNEVWLNYIQLYVENREELMTLTQEEEWKEMMKTVKKLF